MGSTYLRGAAGGILVCDLTRPETIGILRARAADLLDANPDARLIVAANKCDLAEQQRLTPAQVEAAAAELDIPYYITSAKTGGEVEALFRRLGRMLVS
jgi:GTPase SAR1 family protein